MAASSPNPDLGRAEEHDDGDSQGSGSPHDVTTRMSTLAVSPSTSNGTNPCSSTSTSNKQNKKKKNKKPTTPNAAGSEATQAGTSATTTAIMTTTSGQDLHTVPAVISAVEKEIVAAYVKRLDMYNTNAPKNLFFYQDPGFYGQGACSAVKVMQNDEEGFRKVARGTYGRKDSKMAKRRSTARPWSMIEHDIFSQAGGMEEAVRNEIVMKELLSQPPAQFLGG